MANASSMPLRARLLETLGRVFPPMEHVPVADGEHAAFEFAKASGSYAKYVTEIGGIAGKTVLDFGCGWGGESSWLATQADRVIGCDINDQALEQGDVFAARQGQTNLSFVRCGDTQIPLEDASVDAVFSTNVFEHVMQPAAMLAEINRVLRPGGSFVSTFGPLFYSPLGYHLSWASQVPWAHLIFGLDAVMAVRNRKREPIHPQRWEETGLNRITFARFAKAVNQSGLAVTRLRRVPVKGLTPIANLPMVGDLMTFGIDCHLQRPAAANAATTSVRTLADAA